MCRYTLRIIGKRTILVLLLFMWMAMPAQGDEESNHSENTSKSSEAAPDAKIVIYYFHGTYRCPSCTTIEELTDFSVADGFKDELQDGTLEFKAINVETPEHTHYIKDYQLYTKSVIVSEVFNGKEVRWKNLKKVWQLFMKEREFSEYIQHEVADYLEDRSS